MVTQISDEGGGCTFLGTDEVACDRNIYCAPDIGEWMLVITVCAIIS